VIDQMAAFQSKAPLCSCQSGEKVIYICNKETCPSNKT